ncbi:DegV family protein [Tomitella biformata]|uniref:DegV family protein n=1 Tax=Tomitella biformata TaxID=630403 RepID=UPI0004641632|nr:DegV family protein [Tomitella biformata]
MTVIVVTDSTAGLSAELAQAHDIRVVPLHILMGLEDFREGVDEIPAQAPKGETLTSSGASPGELERAYTAALADSGGDGVVAVHMSRHLSGTWDAARQAAESLGPDVRVVDSGAAGMAIGLAAVSAARLATGGAKLDEVYQCALEACERAFSMVYIHRVESLRKGGRIGTAAAFLSTALSMRPLLRLGGGNLELREKTRIPSKALAKLVDLVVAEIGEGIDPQDVELAVQHWHAPDRATLLEQEIRNRIGADTQVFRGEFGPVLGLHLGAGSAGVSVLTRTDKKDSETA